MPVMPVSVELIIHYSCALRLVRACARCLSDLAHGIFHFLANYGRRTKIATTE